LNNSKIFRVIAQKLYNIGCVANDYGVDVENCYFLFDPLKIGNFEKIKY
jgi:hypothetical protein